MSHDLYQHRYLRTTKRATFHDYEGGWYFITICTANRAHYFGEIAKENNENHLHLSSIGTYLAQQIDKTEKIRHDMNVAIPVYAIMPDHVHLLINIGENKYNTCGDAMHRVATKSMPRASQKRFAPQSHNLSSIIRGIKSAVTVFARQNNLEFAWQRRFYDRIVRNQHEKNAIATYIERNVDNWQTGTP